MAKHNLSIKERIESHIVCKNNCWTTDYKIHNGRPTIGINGKNFVLSRIVYEIYKGISPNNLFVCHTCDNPLCINPDHLFLGTPADNTLDCKRKNRLAKGSHHGRAKLTETQVIEIRNLLLQKTLTIRQISKIFDVSSSTISSINVGKHWTHVEGIGSKLESRHTRAKLNDANVKQIKQLLAEGMSLRKIAKQFGVVPQTISDINHNKSWTHVKLESSPI